MPAAATANPPVLTRCPILVCDDSTVDVRHLTGLLEKLGYTAVTPMTDSRRVMPTLTASHFGLILLDIRMPHLGGLELIELIRKDFSAAALPILVITGADSKDIRNAALEAGANDYLDKPIDATEMALRARNLLTISTIYRTNQDILGNLEREVAARTAKLDMLIENGMLMSMTRERTALVRHTLFEGQRLLHCDAASMYVVTEDKHLRFVMRTREDRWKQVCLTINRET